MQGLGLRVIKLENPPKPIHPATLGLSFSAELISSLTAYKQKACL